MCALVCRYVAAVELLGERDETLEELRADLMDVKNLYREQIEFMVMQLTQQQAGEDAGRYAASLAGLGGSMASLNGDTSTNGAAGGAAS